MKNRYLVTVVSTLFLSTVIHAATHTASIQGKEAKNIYSSLTGSAVKEEGAAGHLYRQGKNILCVYVDADMDDSKGKPVPPKDASRYSCTFKYDRDGSIK